MPIYEYRCENCGHRFEALLSSSTDEAVCPKCAGTNLSRLMSSFSTSAIANYKSVQPSGPAPSSGHGGGSCACH